MIKEGAFGGTYFRDIYSGINGKWYKKSWKEFDQFLYIYNYGSTQTYTKLKIYNHQTLKYSKGIWEWIEN